MMDRPPPPAMASGVSGTGPYCSISPYSLPGRRFSGPWPGPKSPDITLFKPPMFALSHLRHHSELTSHQR
jgi:hypothetical protein